MTRRSVLLPERNVLDEPHRVTLVRNAALVAIDHPVAHRGREVCEVRARASVVMIARKALVAGT